MKPTESGVPVSYSTSEYYLDGVHYYSANDSEGLPIEGQYYYDSVPFDNMIYWDIRPSIPDFAESGSGLAYLAGVLPAQCFVQTGDQVICNVNQADFDKAYKDLTDRVQTGDTEAQAALEIIYPAFIGCEYNQDEFLMPLNPEACYDCDSKGMPPSAANIYSNNYKFTVDAGSLNTRTIMSSHYEYGPTMPGTYDDYRTVVNTRLNARTGQFEKTAETKNSGVMQVYAEGVSPREDAAEETSTYENISTNSSVYTYSKSALELDIPDFSEENSQPTPIMNTGTSYWYLINY